ncbi:unnamed protein product [Schistosoma intercalatum]|nr:unnamed protein product [Schistosoma intercalatum]
MKVVLSVIAFAIFVHHGHALKPSVEILKVYKGDNVSSHRCFYISQTGKLDPFLTTTKLELVNFVSATKDHLQLSSSSLAVSVMWNNFSDREILSINPQLLIIVYDGELNLKLKVIFESHAWEVFKRSNLFLDIDQFNEIIYSKRSNQSYMNISVSVFPFIPNAMAYKFLIWILLYGFAVTSISLGAWIIIVNHEKLLLDYSRHQSLLPKFKSSLYLYIIVCLVISVTLLLLTYFLYDVVVYLLIALFVLVGASSISTFLTFVIQRIAPATTKTITINVKCCRVISPGKIYILSLVTFPIGLAIATTWLVFRNNDIIGWPLQSVIGMFIVAVIISSGLIIPSVKVGTLLFTAFLIYDIFFVFITPLFISTASTNVSHSSEHIQLTRTRRSTAHSFMEAVATGSAGKSGELIPLSFRLLINEHIEVNKHNTATMPYTSLLGFGDAVIPGIFIQFLAFYDACWRIPYYRHFLGGILGYSLGFIVTIIMLNVTNVSQPALLYLCPFTLLVTFIVVIVCDGLNEWKLMWSGSLPTLVDNTNMNPTGDSDRVNQPTGSLEVNNLYSIENKSLNHSKTPLVPEQ